MTHINQRRDTTLNWTTKNPVLQLGEVGWETDTRKAKLGNGTATWTALPYIFAPTKADFGLGNVDNTSDFNKPISNATQIALNLKAPLTSPSFLGVPTAPTPATVVNSTQIATTAFVKAQAYAPLTSPALLGVPTAPTAGLAINSTQIATTAFVKSQAYAPLASPAFTGLPTVPTPGSGSNTTQIPNTAFVQQMGVSSVVWTVVGSGGSAPAYQANMGAVSGGIYFTAFTKVGRLVTLTIAVTKSGASAPIFTLPAGYIPSIPVWMGMGGSVAPSVNNAIVVLTTGSVNFGASATANGNYFGSLTFPV